MPSTHLLIDTSYMGYLSYHGMRGKGTDNPYEVADSMLDRVRSVVQQFNASHALFCCDGPPPLHRATMYKGYKAHREAARQQKDPDEVERLDAFRRVLWGMPERLARHGFAVACQPGYEADDMLAEAARRLAGEDVIICTSDEDMFQCFAPGVTMYSPTGKYPVRNAQWLYDNYGLTPAQWVKVKAIAGCTSDNIPGVPGVGEKTAARYILKTLSATSKGYASITAQLEECKARVPLVKLPWPHAILPSDWLDESRLWAADKLEAISGELLGEAASDDAQREAV